MKVKLRDVCDFYSGTGFPSEFQGKTKGQFPFYKVGDISKNVLLGQRRLTFSENYVDMDVINKIKGTIVPANTVVFAKIGEALKLNRRAITNCECLIDNNTIGIKAKTMYIRTLYFYYFMCNLDMQKFAESTTVPSVRKSKLMDISIILPTLDEQQRIEKVLDQINDIIVNRQKQLKKLDELVKSRFIEMFGSFPENSKNWKICTIKEIVSDVRYGTSRAAVDGGKYPYLRMNNITYDGELDLTDLKYIDIPDKELEKCTVKCGDVLFNRTNSKELVGKTCVYNRNDTMVLAGFIIRIRVNENILPVFLAMFLNMDFSKTMLKEMCKSAIGQANINATELQKIRIILPPIELQEEFVEFKNQTDKSKLEIEKSLDKLEILKKSLIQKYFG